MTNLKLCCGCPVPDYLQYVIKDSGHVRLGFYTCGVWLRVLVHASLACHASLVLVASIHKYECSVQSWLPARSHHTSFPTHPLLRSGRAARNSFSGECGQACPFLLGLVDTRLSGLVLHKIGKNCHCNFGAVGRSLNASTILV